MIPVCSLQFYVNFNGNTFKIKKKTKYRYRSFRFFHFLPKISIKVLNFYLLVKKHKEISNYKFICHIRAFYGKYGQKLKKAERPVPLFWFSTTTLHVSLESVRNCVLFIGTIFLIVLKIVV